MHHLPKATKPSGLVNLKIASISGCGFSFGRPFSSNSISSSTAGASVDTGIESSSPVSGVACSSADCANAVRARTQNS